MRLALASALMLALLALAGCGSQEAPQAPEANSRPAEAAATTSAPEGSGRTAPAPAAPAPPPMGQVFAPFPYTPEQIRDASPSGRHVVFRIVQAGGELRQEMTFTGSDEQGTIVESVMLNAEGEGQSGQRRMSWQQLQAHASYPASFTTVTSTEVEVGAGTFSAKLYQVGDGQGGVERRVWFADELPGPPVLMEVYEKGERTFRMEMIENGTADEAAAAE